VWLIKTDDEGNKLWDKRFRGAPEYGGHSIYGANSVQQTTDGGYIVGGHRHSYIDSTSHILMIRTDSEGNRLWDKMFVGSASPYDGTSNSDRSVQQTTDGGYIIVGSTFRDQVLLMSRRMGRSIPSATRRLWAP